MEEVNVSVIVPIYNTEKFLRKCIESILNQTLENIEIILINDGSTDNSSSICEEYSREFPQKIRYISNENRGCSATRNLGINLSQGEYITFVDSDDYIDSEMLQEMYHEIKKGNLDIVVSGIKVIYPKINKVVYSCPKKKLKKLDYLKNKNNMSYCTSKLYNRRQIIKSGVYFPLETHHGEDLYFSFICLVTSKNIGCIEKCYYNYVHHGKNSVYNLDKRLGIFITFSKLYDYLLKENYIINSLIKKLFYDAFNETVIKSTFFILSNSELVSQIEYKKYDKLFYNKLKKVKFLSLKSKMLIYYYRNISYGIRKFGIYKELKNIKCFINERIKR